MAKKIINLTGSLGLTKKFGGDIIDSGYTGYNQEGKPNLRYNTQDGQMAHGTYDPFIKNGYLSPSPVTILHVPQDTYGSNLFSRGATATLVDDVNKTLWYVDREALFYQSAFYPSEATRYAFGSSATEYVDMTVYYLNGVRTGFLGARTSTGNIVKTFSLTSPGTKNETWSSSSVTGAFSLDQSYAISFVVSGDGFMYILNKNAVHRVDGTTIGGPNGTIYKNILVGSEDINLTHGVEFKNKMFIVVQKGYDVDYRGSDSTDVSKFMTTDKGKVGIYMWNRQATVFNSSDFIDLPGVAAVKNIWVTPSNKLCVMALTSDGTVQILIYDGTKFVAKETLPSGADTNKRHALKIYGNFTYWLANDGYIYRYGADYGDDNDVITVIGKYVNRTWGQIEPVVLACASHFYIFSKTNSNYAPDVFYVIGEFESGVYTKKVFFPTAREYGVVKSTTYPNLTLQEQDRGDIFTGVTLLPTLSNVKHINILCAPNDVNNTTGFNAYNNDTSKVTFSSGKFGNGALFSNSFNNIVLPENNLTRYTTPFSISFWTNSSAGGVDRVLYSNYSVVDSKTAGIYIGQNTSGTINFRTARNTGVTANTDYKDLNSTTVVNGTLTHVLCVWTGSEVKLYINGTLEASASWSYAPGYNTDYNYHSIGAATTNKGGTGINNVANGIIDDFAIITKVLSSSEITELQTNPLSDTSLNNTSSVMLYYPLDSDVNDYSRTDLKTQEEAKVKIYFNQSTTPYMTKIITREDIYKGYKSIEINKPFINSIQLEIEYFNSNNLNSEGRFTPAGLVEFNPFYAELIYEETNTLR